MFNETHRLFCKAVVNYPGLTAIERESVHALLEEVDRLRVLAERLQEYADTHREAAELHERRHIELLQQITAATRPTARSQTSEALER